MEQCASLMHRSRTWSLCAVMLLLIFNVALAPAQTSVKFAGISDYGSPGAGEQSVANLVAAHAPDFIVTAGDNDQANGTLYEDKVAQYYASYIGGYSGTYGTGPTTNKFFPVLGNHDWDGTNGVPYMNFFTLPGAGFANSSGNERYYDFVQGPVHFFMINANGTEPDGNGSTSTQALWLQAELAAATEPWKIIIFHQPPYSSGASHGSEIVMQWPFEAWGATAAFSGHNHVYERVMRDDNSDGVSMPYFTIGLGGHAHDGFGTIVGGSAVRYSADFGAMIAEASHNTLTVRFYSVNGGATGTLQDEFTLNNPNPDFLETFDSFTVDQPVSAQPGWYTDGAGPTVGASNGVAGSRGLNGAQYNCTWTEHTFTWNDAGLQKVLMGLDFQTSSTGLFDDDRVCWTILNNNTSSDAHFGVQLDNNEGHGIETYWDNISGGTSNIRIQIAALPTLGNNAWYRLRAEITKLTPTSASIAVTLHQLDGSGNVGPLVASGTLANTAALSSSETPDPKYFNATAMWPAYKNFTSTPGSADNAYFSTSGGASTGIYSLTTNVIGSGTVTKNPNVALYDPDAVVTLTASPSAGYLFSGWSGDLSGSTNPTTIAMTGNKTVTATFTQVPVGDTLPLVPFGATWRYNDAGTDLGTSWRETPYNDAAWASGPARLGFGDTQVTPVNGGPDGTRYPTIYFRTTFNVADPVQLTSMGINLIRDDGVVIYLNGTEIWRSNMPAGAVSFGTLAPVAIGGTDEYAVVNSGTLGTTGIVSGINVLAVEVHQNAATSSDLGFDMRLYATTTTVGPKTLTVNVIGQGIVTKNPNQTEYTPGSTVELTATAASGWLFNGWSGDLAGTTNPATVTMNSHKNITATFMDPLASLVGHWKMNETSGTTAGDASGRNNNGTVTGGTWGAGRVGGAVNLNGTTGAVKIPTTSSLALTNQLTFACWMNADVLSNSWVTLAQRSNSANSWFDFELYARSSDAPTAYNPVFRVDFNGNSSNDENEQVQGNINLQAQTWYHIAVTYDGTALRFYIDGTLRNSTAHSGGTIPNSGRGIWLGANEAWGEPFDGRLDEVRIYNRALSQTEIQGIMNASGLPQYVLTMNISGNGVVNKAPTLATYDSGSVVQLTAVPLYGNVFSQWSGALTGTTNPQSLTMLGHRTVTATFVPGATTAPLTFVAVGDYGIAGTNETNVSNLIHSLNPDIMITTGDNNYPSGSASTIDANVGQYFHDLIGAYTGTYGAGSPVNRFFPSTGNHDWDPAGATPYLNYFTLPGAGYTNSSGIELYYDFVIGPVHFFAIDSDPRSSAGQTSTSAQGQWLQAQLAAATEPWKVVYFHHAPYTSGTNHGPTVAMQWPFEAWGADAVLAAHEHHYERIVRDVNGDGLSIPYIVTGAGANNLYPFGTPTAGSMFRYNANYGTVYALATDTTLTFRFFSITGGGTLLDTMQLVKLEGKFLLSVNVIGSGTVARNPNLLGYDPGTPVELTATPGAGFEFTGWSSALSGSENPATITMDANKAVTATFTSIFAGDTTNFVPFGATWKYRDNGTDLGTTWREPGFNDAAWSSGPARLGYGGDGEITAVSYGPDANNKYITTYFRTSFNITDPTQFATLGIGAIRDDGIVVYLNGTEIWRDNMPAGTVVFGTFAPVAVGNADELAVFPSGPLSTSALVAGTNVLAVEVHQAAVTSTDLALNLRLYGAEATPMPTDWVAFNDMNGVTGDGNASYVTRHTYQAANAALIDSATGATLGVTVTGSYVGGHDPQPSNGGPANAGTDAAKLFGPTGAVIVDLSRTLELDATNWQNTITFNNLDPAKVYDIALTSNRNEPTYVNARYTKVTISGATAFTNTSSAGVVVNSTSSVSFSTGYNTVNGYVARWTGVNPGPDGSFSVMSEWDNTQGSGTQNTKGYAMWAFRLASHATSSESETKAVAQAKTDVSFPASGVVMNFSTLPAGGGSITITRYEAAPGAPPTFPIPPAGATYLPLWFEITSTLPVNSFVGLVTLDVSGIPGFGATSHLMSHSGSASAWIPMPGTYNAGNNTFTFTATHFTSFGFANVPGSAYELYVATAPATPLANIIYPNTVWGTTTTYEPDDWTWTGAQLMSVYLTPQVGSVFGVCNLTVEWDSTVMHLEQVNWGSAGSPNGLFGHGQSYTAAALYDQLGYPGRVTLNCSRLDNANFTTVAGDYVAEIVFRLLKPGYSPVSVIASDVRTFVQGQSPAGVFVTPHISQVKAYLGDFAGSAGESSGDGKIDFDDLVVWSYSYWSGVPGYVPGMQYYKTKYDIAPTHDGLLTSLPVADGRIDFEDLVMFSVVYGEYNAFHLLKAAPASEEGMTIATGTPLVSNGETRVPVLLSGNVQDVRALSMTASGKFGKLIGVEKGTLLQGYSTPVIIMSNSSSGRVHVDLAIAGLSAKSLAAEGEVVILRFAGSASIGVSRAEARSSANMSLMVKVKATEKEIPAIFALDQNYPNPFNPTTSIQFQVPSQANVQIRVYNVLGEEVTTLVNEVREAGVHTVEWNGRNNAGAQVTSGIYFYRMQAGDFTTVKKMVLLK